MKRFALLMCLLLTGCASGPPPGLQPIRLTVRGVASGEDAHLVSDKGLLRLPTPCTRFDIDYVSLTKMITYFEKHKGKQCTVYVDDNVVLGISNGTKIFPAFGTRRKIVYGDKPRKLSTTLRRWSFNMYGLTLKTDYGTYCLSSNYEYSDYYSRTFPLLHRAFREDTELEADITIYFHGSDDTDDCAGEIESIELP